MIRSVLVHIHPVWAFFAVALWGVASVADEELQIAATIHAPRPHPAPDHMRLEQEVKAGQLGDHDHGEPAFQSGEDVCRLWLPLSFLARV
jgi:hypothetical protein